MSEQRERGRHSGLEDPPNSRLFVISGRGSNEEDFREAFEKFGDVEDIWIVRDKATNEQKGVSYIKFAKTSQALTAMEEMNGQIVKGNSKPIKVLVASNRSDGNRKDNMDDEKLLRLFVCIPKAWTEENLRETFQEYGDIDYVNIVKNRMTKDSKGLAYVKYHKASHAALALEGCDKSLKAVFAQPKVSRFDKGPAFARNAPPSRFDNTARGNYGGTGSNWNYDGNNMQGSANFGGGYGGGGGDGGGGNSHLEMTLSPQITQDQLYRLCDLFPGLEHCDLKLDMSSGRSRGVAIIKYQNHTYANYAKEKLLNFEYPPGSRLSVKWAELNNSGYGVPGALADQTQAAQLISTLTHALSSVQQLPSAMQGQGYNQGSGDGGVGALASIAQSLNQAVGALQQCGVSVDTGSAGYSDTSRKRPRH